MKPKRGKKSNHPNVRTQEPSQSKKWLAIGAIAVAGIALLAFVFFRTNQSAAKTTAWVEPLPPAEGAAVPTPPAWMAEMPAVQNPTAPAAEAPAVPTAQSPIGKPAVATSTAVTATTAPPTGPQAAIKRITASELRSAVERGEAFVIDVRDADSYASGHIEGSKNIPLSQIDSAVNSLPREKMIVAYCT